MPPTSPTSQVLSFCASAANSPLLNLPRELRDQVYHALFGGSCFKIDQFDAITILSYDGATDESAGLPRWLFTSKQILHEGMEQFYRQAQGVDCRQRSAQSDLTLDRKKLKMKRRISRRSSKQILTLASLHCVRSISLDDIHLRYYTDFAAPATTPATLYISSLHKVLPLRRWVECQRDSMKALKLTFVHPTLHLAYYSREWRVNISQIEHLGAFERVEFAIFVPGSPGLDGYVQPCATATAELRKELIRLATALVEQSGEICIPKTWTSAKKERQGTVEENHTTGYEWHVEVTRNLKSGPVEGCQ